MDLFFFKEFTMYKKRFTQFFFAVMFLIASSGLAQAYIGLCCAHCGGNMPLNILGGGVPETHEFRFKVSQMYMQMGPLRSGTNDIGNVTDILGAPGALNNEDIFLVAPTEMRTYMTMASAAYSFTDNFAAMAMLSYVRNEMDMQFFSGTGNPDFTMFSDDVSDLAVMGKYRLYADDHLAPTSQLSMVLGASFPTGSIEQKFTRNPVASQNGRILPFGMQTGSGTVDPIVGLTYQGSSDPNWYGLNLMLEAHVYDNDQGYHRGQEFRYDLYFMRQVSDSLVLQAQLNGKYEGSYSDEPFAGSANGDGHRNFDPNQPFLSPLFDPNNYGGHKLDVSFGFQYQHTPLHIMELVASLPIHQDLNGPQLGNDWMIQFTYYFELPTKKSRRYVGFKPPKELGF
jgi:hypothetical protein